MDAPDNRRIVRIPLPTNLIRRIDELIIAGNGGFESRAEFILDAIQERLLEIEYPPANEPDTPQLETVSLPQPDLRSEISAAPDHIPQWEDTSLHLPHTEDILIHHSKATCVDEPLFGLHNRDYPSLWAAAQIADIGVTPYDQAIQELLHRAWSAGETLQLLDEHYGTKSATLFPTNRKKPQAAERRFQHFAVGIILKDDNHMVTIGPLFQWNIIAADTTSTDVLIGLTPEGHRLLQQLQGLTALEPHEEQFAFPFLQHLSIHSNSDWAALQQVVQFIKEHNTDRATLTSHMEATFCWKGNQVETNTAGYVARAREWGLLQPKQNKGLYGITDFGNAVLETIGHKESK
ncbi:MAG: ribbon-helix-helix domain-containing protein [bacterium]|nr:ribbon-helix-helix domain-containing protein [bacterium]